jgi:hypothetical protein
MTSIQSMIIQYIKDNIPYPSGLIGCHAANGQKPYSCCEYDVAIFCDKGKANPETVITFDKAAIEFIQFPMHIHEGHYVYLKDMVILKDNDNFFLSSMLARLKEKKYDRLLKIYARRQIVESLFLYESIDKNLSKCPILSSFWLKISAFHYISGILAIHGIKSSPSHELEQIRSLDVNTPETASGLHTALDCIGIERAGTSAISRSLTVFNEISNSNENLTIWSAKLKWMLDQGRVADCYYYLGKISADYILSQDEGFVDRFLKPIGILLDISKDTQQIHKLHGLLVKSSKDALKSSVR